MKYSTPRRTVSSLLVVFQISLALGSFYTTTASAQSQDTEPPNVTFEQINEARKGDSQVFTVTATDNVGIDSVVIFYRMSTEQPYDMEVMPRIGDTNLFSYSLNASAIPESANGIQYYIEAKDSAGNRTLEGFSFDPFERVLLDRASSTVANAAQAESESDSLIGSMSTTQKVLYGALGLVVVGALVSAASDSGDDSGPTQSSGVPLTITVNPLITTQ